MKKMLLVMFITLFMALPVMAQNADLVSIFQTPDIDVDLSYEDEVTIDVAKYKLLLELEALLKLKLVFIDVDVTLDTSEAAEANAFVKAINDYAFGCEDCTQKDAYLTDSILDNTGIVQTNQATGHINNQGNVIAIAVDDTNGGTNGTGSFTEAQAVVEQANLYSATYTTDSAISAYIDGSINGNKGIVQFNQSSGNINNQHNVIALAVGGAGVALSEAVLGQANAFVVAIDRGTPRYASIYESINSNTGIVQVNQNVGTLNNQGNVISISGAVR
jgi:hypothetical protein